MSEKTVYHVGSLVGYAVTVCLMARNTVSPYMIQSLINSAPRSSEESQCDRWIEKSFCFQLLVEADYKKRLHDWAQKELDCAAHFWLKEFPLIPLHIRNPLVAQINATNDFYANQGEFEMPPRLQKILSQRQETCNPQVLAFHTSN